MFASFFSFLNEISTVDAKHGSRRKRVEVCKDEVDQQKPLTQSKPEKTKAKKRVSFETKPIVYAEKSCCDRKAELKVKILMTKDEAARLLKNCKDGGRLEFKDVARELVQIPVDRVHLVSSRDRRLLN